MIRRAAQGQDVTQFLQEMPSRKQLDSLRYVLEAHNGLIRKQPEKGFAYTYASLPLLFDDWRPQEKQMPKYLLVLRYRTPLSQTLVYATMPATYSSDNWVYLAETYNKIEQVLNRLNAQPFNEQEFIGFWELDKQKQLPIEQKKIHHQQEKKVVVDEWDEYKWVIKDN